ncbi:MAG: dipeptide epimerase [Caulobacteraceae bacterium]
MPKLQVRADDLRMKAPFAITGHVFDAMPTIVVTLCDGASRGRGEASGVYYLNDGPVQITHAIEAIRGEIEAGLSREALRARLPPCGARNALDCALWELEATRARQPVWRLAGLEEVRPLTTVMSCGADAPDAMARIAVGFADARAIKLKLTGEPDLDARRVEAVRAARPDVWLSVDANQGYSLADLREVLPAFVKQGVSLVEQPLPRGEDDALDGFSSPIPLAADESAQSTADVAALVGRYQVVNIKLDKCGGLTEALAMAEAARHRGLELMVGNMGGSSWAMAAAFVVGQSCDVVDLDGPLWLTRDRSPGAEYREGRVWCGDEVWGGGEPLPAAATG